MILFLYGWRMSESESEDGEIEDETRLGTQGENPSLWLHQN